MADRTPPSFASHRRPGFLQSLAGRAIVATLVIVPISLLPLRFTVAALVVTGVLAGIAAAASALLARRPAVRAPARVMPLEPRPSPRLATARPPPVPAVGGPAGFPQIRPPAVPLETALDQEFFR